MDESPIEGIFQFYPEILQIRYQSFPAAMPYLNVTSE